MSLGTIILDATDTHFGIFLDAILEFQANVFLVLCLLNIFWLLAQLSGHLKSLTGLFPESTTGTYIKKNSAVMG